MTATCISYNFEHVLGAADFLKWVLKWWSRVIYFDNWYILYTFKNKYYKLERNIKRLQANKISLYTCLVKVLHGDTSMGGGKSEKDVNAIWKATF